jgi:hypothetical protein
MRAIPTGKTNEMAYRDPPSGGKAVALIFALLLTAVAAFAYSRISGTPSKVIAFSVAAAALICWCFASIQHGFTIDKFSKTLIEWSCFGGIPFLKHTRETLQIEGCNCIAVTKTVRGEMGDEGITIPIPIFAVCLIKERQPFRTLRRVNDESEVREFASAIGMFLELPVYDYSTGVWLENAPIGAAECLRDRLIREQSIILVIPRPRRFEASVNIQGNNFEVDFPPQPFELSEDWQLFWGILGPMVLIITTISFVDSLRHAETYLLCVFSFLAVSTVLLGNLRARVNLLVTNQDIFLRKSFWKKRQLEQLSVRDLIDVRIDEVERVERRNKQLVHKRVPLLTIVGRDRIWQVGEGVSQDGLLWIRDIILKAITS